MCVMRGWRSEGGWVKCLLNLTLDGGPALLHKAEQDLLELAQGLKHLDGHTHLGGALKGRGSKKKSTYVHMVQYAGEVANS